MQADQPVDRLGKNGSRQRELKDFLTRVTDAEKEITVATGKDKTAKRPLYVDYTIEVPRG